MRVPAVIAISAALITAPAFARADPISVVLTNRVVSTVGQAAVGSDSVAADEQRDEDVMNSTSIARDANTTAEATAHMESRVDATGGLFEGRGSVSATIVDSGEFAAAGAGANYFVIFDLSEPQQFRFTATFGGTPDTLEVLNRFTWGNTLWLRDPDRGSSTFVFLAEGFGSEVLTETGLLLPGRYGFSAHTSANVFAAAMLGAQGTFDFRLDLSDPMPPIPEPATMLLLGTGLAGAACRVRSRRKAVPAL